MTENRSFVSAVLTVASKKDLSPCLNRILMSLAGSEGGGFTPLITTSLQRSQKFLPVTVSALPGSPLNALSLILGGTHIALATGAKINASVNPVHISKPVSTKRRNMKEVYSRSQGARNEIFFSFLLESFLVLAFVFLVLSIVCAILMHVTREKV